MANLNYYIGPWRWLSETEDGFPYWAPPPGTVASVDLASTQVLEQSPRDSYRPVGFFAVNGLLPSEWTLLGQGDLREIHADGAIRSAWDSVGGYYPAGDTLADLLMDALTGGSDPDGGDACLPLMPNSRLELVVDLAGHSVVQSRRFLFGTDPHTTKLKALLQRQLMIVRKSSTEGHEKKRGKTDFEHHRQFADWCCEKYGVEFEHLRPRLWPKNEGRLKHETVVTESFNTADGDSLGPDLPWTELSGDIDIVSNAAKIITIIGRARADSVLSGVDMYAKFNCTTFVSGSNVESIHRYNGSANTGYIAMTRNGATTTFRVFKLITGTTTQLVSNNGTPPTAVFENKGISNGSTISLEVNGVSQASVTDSAVDGISVGGKYGGIGGSSAANSVYDAFEAGDLAGSVVTFVQLERSIQRGMFRGMWTRF